MRYKRIKLNNYNLNLIKTNKFKTNLIKVCFQHEFNEKEVALRNFLITYMVYTTNTYKTHRDIVLKSEDLYGTTIASRSYRLGKTDNIEFNLLYLNPKYTEPSMELDSLLFLKDILFNPNFKQDSFNKIAKYLKNSMKNDIETIKENKELYASIRLKEEMNKEYISSTEFGKVKEIEDITLNDLINYYNYIINNSYIDIYVSGDISFNIIKLFKKYFIFNNSNNYIEPFLKINFNKLKTIKEKDNSNQSKLAIACDLIDLTYYEKYFVLPIYNRILGATSKSKFFNIVREKHSLCYYCNSKTNIYDNVLYIYAGLSKNNYDKTISLIKKIILDITKGKITKEEIKCAKEDYYNALKENDESLNNMINYIKSTNYIIKETIKERRKIVKEVSYQDIIDLSKKIKIDTIYFLEGE